MANVFLKKDEESKFCSTKDSIDRVPTKYLLRDGMSTIIFTLQTP